MVTADQETGHVIGGAYQEMGIYSGNRKAIVDGDGIRGNFIDSHFIDGIQTNNTFIFGSDLKQGINPKKLQHILYIFVQFKH